MSRVCYKTYQSKEQFISKLEKRCKDDALAEIMRTEVSDAQDILRNIEAGGHNIPDEKIQDVTVLEVEEYFQRYGCRHYFVEEGLFGMLSTMKLAINPCELKGYPVAISWHPNDIDWLPSLMHTGLKTFVLTNSFEGGSSPDLYQSGLDTNMDTLLDGFTDLDYNGNSGRYVDFDSPELSGMKLWIKANIGAYLYAHAFPEMVRPGFPDCMKARSINHAIHAKITAITVKSDRGVMSPHFRNGHFRCLGHERFEHNTDGSPKIIYVNPSVVGKLDPYTVMAGEESR